jgi:hypothetical protein
MAALVAVELNFTKLPSRFSDNVFALRPGVPVELTFTAWEAFAVQGLVGGLRVRSAADGVPTRPVWTKYNTCSSAGPSAQQRRRSAQ